MKTKNFFQMMMGSVMTMFMLTSCDTEFFYYDGWGNGSCADQKMDYNQSKAFAGQWTGDFGMFYNYAIGGNIYTYDSYDTDIVFYPDYSGATHGYGKQVDFYEYGPYEYIYHKFEWSIKNGIVYLYYSSDSSLDCWIRDYTMNNNYFYGYFGDSDSRFSLKKISDYYNWTPYVSTYSYGERRDWYGSLVKGEKGFSENDSILNSETSTTEGIVSFGNRFNK